MYTYTLNVIRFKDTSYVWSLKTPPFYILFDISINTPELYQNSERYFFDKTSIDETSQVKVEK